MIDQFLQDAPRWLARIERGIRDGDTEDAADAAAALAGASDAVGALDIADRAARLEHAVRSEDPQARSMAAMSADALGDLQERLREQRAQGWPKG